VDNRTYGDLLTIDVVAKNENGYGPVQKLIMEIEGAGDNYALTQINQDPLQSGKITVVTPPGTMGLISDYQELPLSSIEWYLNNQLTTSQQTANRQAMFFLHDEIEIMSAILISTNGCKSKLQYNN
jgi:hypothetical protein